MFRGEIFAYPLFLQNTLSKENVAFFCSDVACKYWPYLKRVVEHCPELSPLLNMRPLLSVMHAKAHEWSCEVRFCHNTFLEYGHSLLFQQPFFFFSFFLFFFLVDKMVRKKSKGSWSYNRRRGGAGQLLLVESSSFFLCRQ